MKCSGQAVKKLNASEDKVQRDIDIDSTHVREIDDLDYMQDDSVVKAKDEVQKHQTNRVEMMINV